MREASQSGVRTFLILLVLMGMVFDGPAASLNERIRQTLELPKPAIEFPFTISVQICDSMEEFGKPGPETLTKRIAEAKDLAGKEV